MCHSLNSEELKESSLVFPEIMDRFQLWGDPKTDAYSNRGLTYKKYSNCVVDDSKEFLETLIVNLNIVDAYCWRVEQKNFFVNYIAKVRGIIVPRNSRTVLVVLSSHNAVYVQVICSWAVNIKIIHNAA